MYFKKLELKGFKSFAEKTVLEFEPGVTAIVGPNGCGKSNISDAVRWVFGEQSPKSMRGLTMEDVIFNGTQALEPVNFAEVSLTLQNESKILPIEYDEVVLSRRLYRSGESEYLLNRNVVRLRDIQDLLAGTGLGVNHYSLIEQGKIDGLIHSRPDARRELFDEAAGISRFKSRKKEALRKLELTEQNLQRVTDIIGEVKRQIGSVERQAKKAENYKKDFERVKRYDVGQATFQLKGLRENREKISKEVGAAKCSMDSSEIILQDVNKLLRDSRENLKEVEESFADLQTKRALIENQIKSASEKKGLYEDQIRENQEKSEQISARLEKTAGRILGLMEENKHAVSTYELILQENEEGGAALKASEDDYCQVEESIKSVLEEAEEIKAQLVENASASAQTQNELTKIESELQNLLGREHRLNVEKHKVETEWKDAANRFESASREAEGLVQEIRGKIHEREALEADLVDAQHALRNTREKIQQAANESSSIQSKLEVLRGITSAHEGFSQGVRFILERARQDELLGRGILGALADLVEVERGYELALEVSLQGYAQSVVCLSREDAVHAAQVLRQGGGGQVTFVFLEGDREQDTRPVSSDAFDVSETKHLIEFANAQSKVSRLFAALVGKTFLVSSLERGLQLRSRYPDCTFVTQRGELCQGDMIVGGSRDISEESLLFGRESRIQELKGKLAELEWEKERWSLKEAELSERERSLVEGIRVYSIVLPKLQVQLADISSKRDHLGSLKAKLEEELSVVDVELTETRQAVEEARQKEAELRQRMKSIEEGGFSLQKRLEETHCSVEERTTERENLLVEITRKRSAQETLTDRKNSAHRDVERTQTALRLEDESRLSLETERDRLAQRNAAMEKQIRELENEMGQHGADRETLLQKNTDIVSERERWLGNVSDLEAKKTHSEEAVLGIQKKYHDLQINLNGLQHEMQIVRERISANYQIQLAEESLPEADVSAAGATEEIERIREKLRKAGPVNLVAIDEYEEMRKRFEFLTQEQNDLLSAKDDIHKAILKMNRQTREMFADAFTKIQSAFVEYFKVLFGGGTAELVLLDEMDILESGIEIIARPPGKKLQNISLLSGGEKALTAIALLFAVFRVKPSPFCILDEVDAALDEMNIQRFLNLLQEFVKGSQFIIVTHSKRTMALADVMYGITMRQSGISEVVSVKFAHEEDYEVADGPRQVLA